MFSKVCRLCASKDEYCVAIFGTDGEKHKLLHKMKVCAPISVVESDSFPKQICLECLNTLDQIYDFYQKVKNAQMELKDMQKREELMKSSEEEQQPPSDPNIKQTPKMICIKNASGTKFTFPKGTLDDGLPKTRLGQTDSASKIDSSHPPLFVHLSEVSGVVSQTDKCPSNPEKTSENAISERKPSNESSMVNDHLPNIAKNKDCSNEKRSTTKEVENNINTKESEECGRSSNVSEKDMESQNNTLNSGEVCASSLKPLEPSKMKRILPGQSGSQPSVKKFKAASSIKLESSPNNLPLNKSGPNDKSSSSLPFKKCRHCDKEFREDILLQHEKLHNGKPVYTCAECDGFFLHASTLEKHKCSGRK